MKKNKWFLNGGRGSGKTFRLLCETYENKIAELKRSCEETQKLLDKQIEATYRLDKENAELKCECRRCVYSDCPCILSDYGKDRNGICDHFKDVFDEVVELKEENAELKHTIAELRRDKDNLNMHTKAQEKLSEYRSDQLTKAKELLERLLITSCNSDVLNLLPNCSEVLRVRVEAEQFLKEVEK